MHFGPGSSRKRHDDRGGPSRDTVTSREREGAGEAPRCQPDHDPEVAQAVEYGRCPDGAEGASLDRPDLRGGGDDRRLPAAHLLPLDDCLYGLQPTIPHLTRSSLHRCLERHGISSLPEMKGDTPKLESRNASDSTRHTTSRDRTPRRLNTIATIQEEVLRRTDDREILLRPGRVGARRGCGRGRKVEPVLRVRSNPCRPSTPGNSSSAAESGRSRCGRQHVEWPLARARMPGLVANPAE